MHVAQGKCDSGSVGIRIAVAAWTVLCAISCARDDGKLVGTATPGERCAEPGSTAFCYTGPGGTVGIGICAGGVTTCTWDLVWTECVSEQLPAEDICTNALDDD